MQTSFDRQIHEGMEVLDTNGEKIGMAGETLGDYFNVDAGFLGTTEYYIPFSAVTDVTDDSISVNVTKDQVKSMGWDRRPETTRHRESTGSESTVQLREEELQTRKTSQETGRVQLGKDVVEEHRTMDVPVTREEVYVERRPVDRRPSDRPIDANATETTEVPVREEQVEVEKRPVVYEEVGVGKREIHDTQRVSDTVRREELRTDKEGDVEFREDPDR